MTLETSVSYTSPESYKKYHPSDIFKPAYLFRYHSILTTTHTFFSLTIDITDFTTHRSTDFTAGHSGQAFLGPIDIPRRGDHFIFFTLISPAKIFSENSDSGRWVREILHKFSVVTVYVCRTCHPPPLYNDGSHPPSSPSLPSPSLPNFPRLRFYNSHQRTVCTRNSKECSKTRGESERKLKSKNCK